MTDRILMKTWIVNSGNPRPSHSAVNGETIPYNDLFGNGMMYPGDPAAPPSELAGCTCTLDVFMEPPGEIPSPEAGTPEENLAKYDSASYQTRLFAEDQKAAWYEQQRAAIIRTAEQKPAPELLRGTNQDLSYLKKGDEIRMPMSDFLEGRLSGPTRKNDFVYRLDSESLSARPVDAGLVDDAARYINSGGRFEVTDVYLSGPKQHTIRIRQLEVERRPVPEPAPVPEPVPVPRPVEPTPVEPVPEPPPVGEAVPTVPENLTTGRAIGEWLTEDLAKRGTYQFSPNVDLNGMGATTARHVGNTLEAWNEALVGTDLNKLLSVVERYDLPEGVLGQTRGGNWIQLAARPVSQRGWTVSTQAANNVAAIVSHELAHWLAQGTMASVRFTPIREAIYRAVGAIDDAGKVVWNAEVRERASKIVSKYGSSDTGELIAEAMAKAALTHPSQATGWVREVQVAMEEAGIDLSKFAGLLK